MKHTMLRLASGANVAESLPVGWQLGQDTVMSSLILGKPQNQVYPGKLILPDRPTRTMTVKWPVFGTEHLKKFKTERAAGADIGTRRFAVSYDRAELKRYTFGTRFDEIELENAAAAGMMPMALQEAGYELARRAVEDDLERIRHGLLTTPGNYAAANELDASGAPWNTTGNSYNDVRSVVEAISNKTGVGGKSIRGVIATDALNAVYRDANFQAVRNGAGGGQGLRIPTNQEIADYWGIDRLDEADIRVVDDDTTTITTLYSGKLILYRPTGTPGVDTTFGDVVPGVTFTMGRGGARPVVNMAEATLNTDRVFPWERIALPKVFSYDAMGLIYGILG